MSDVYRALEDQAGWTAAVEGVDNVGECLCDTETGTVCRAHQGYRADGRSVLFDGAGGTKQIAEADDPSWARHIATALNHWSETA